jgi:hypothetical protein
MRENVLMMYLVQGRYMWWTCEKSNEHSDSTNGREFDIQLSF